MDNFMKIAVGVLVSGALGGFALVMVLTGVRQLYYSAYFKRRRLIKELQDPAIRGRNLRTASVHSLFKVVLCRKYDELLNSVDKNDIELYSLIQLRIAELQEAGAEFKDE